MTNEMTGKGQRISRKKVNADRHIPLFEFLLHDPIYREMSEKSKILYCYLRHKVEYFGHEKGHSFVSAANTELGYILNCSEATVIKTKKELVNYGLLEEVRQKDKSNQIYPLKPKVLSEW